MDDDAFLNLLIKEYNSCFVTALPASDYSGNPHRKGGCRLPIPQQVMDASGLALEEHANASDGSYRLDHKDLWASPRYNLFRIDGSRTHNI